MTNAQISLEEAVRLLRGPCSDGKIFSVDFVKRTNGEIRRMICRRKVKSNGGTLNYNPTEYNLLIVFDIEARAYRTVSLERVLRIAHHGQVIDVVETLA